jgi:D-alanyl-D-alanine carboxypeptidase (penicillin-binding protein 5/6)
MSNFFSLTAILLFVFLSSTNSANATQNQHLQQYPTLKNADYFLLMDQDSGDILLQKNADIKTAPSSLTKLMTAYVIFYQIQKGKIRLDNQCLIGKDAWKKRGSTMFLEHGDIVSVDKLIDGLLVVSGNDAATALAEIISGSVDNFAILMNNVAKKIGLKNSQFKNPHGLNQDGHYMSLRDLSIVATRIAKDFPQYLHYFSKTDFTYQNIHQLNRNPLIKKSYEGSTGMKTGYTNDGGYGIVGTATRKNRKLIAITNKAQTSSIRNKIVVELMDYGFDNYKRIKLFSKNQTIAKATTWLGTKDNVGLVSNKEISVNILNNIGLNRITVKVKYKTPIYTPIVKNQKIGDLIIKIDNKIIQEIPLFAKESIDKKSYFARIYQVTKYKFDQFWQSINFLPNSV